jgi:hypothetical protein
MISLIALALVQTGLPPKDEPAFLGCLFEQARSAQAQNLSVEEFQLRIGDACKAEEAEYEAKLRDRALASARTQEIAHNIAQEEVARQRSAIVRIYRARTSTPLNK